MFAIELSTSMDWALEILGTASIASAVTPCLARFFRRLGLRAGLSMPTRTAPFLRRFISVGVGALTLRTMSAFQVAAMVPTLAPAAT